MCVKQMFLFFFSALVLLLHIQQIVPLRVSLVGKMKNNNKNGCGKNSLHKCLWNQEEIEMEMDSEVNKRQLWEQKKYISYEALKGDLVPCMKPGVAYYNCRAMPTANPYTRGCSAISECRGSP